MGGEIIFLLVPVAPIVVVVLLAVGIASSNLVWPHNRWCCANPFDCVVESLGTEALVWLMPAVAFAIGARLPLLPRRSASSSYANRTA